MDEKDWKQLPRENVIGVFTDGESVEVYYRAGGDVHNIILPYRGFLTTSDAMVAQSAEIKDVASVEELTGSGLRWLLRPKAGHTVRTLLEWISLRTAEPVRRSSKYDIPEIREAFLLDSGIRLFTAMPNTELRVAFVSLLVGCEKQSACRFDFNDPANVVIGAAVSCDDEEYSFSGDEATVVRDLFECIDHLDCDVLIGFQLASRGVHHLLAAESRAVRVADHNVAQYAERLVLARPSLLDLEALCGDATDRRAAPRDLQELADRCGTTFAGAVSRRELIGRRSCPNEVRAAAFAAVRLTRELAEKYLAGALEVARTMPRALDDVVHSFAGEHLSAKMREYYFTRGHALPVPSVGNADGGGGLIETPARGRFERVGHLDLSNAYATVIVARELAASVDALRAFPKIVGEWMRARQRAEEMARACAGAGNIHEARQWQAIVKRYKGLLVTAFGLTGARHYRFADRSVMAEIGSTVYDIARTMWDAVEDAGARVLCVDTDGLYFDSESGAELDYEWVRTHAEEAIRVASGIETLSLRVAGPHEAGLITPRLRLLSNGERKGWSDGNLSPFALRVREDVVRHLLAGASQMAVEVVKEALAALESHHVPARDVAQMFVVDGPPVLAITRPGFGRSEMSAALAGGAVDGEMIGLVKVQGGNGSVWTAVGNEMGEVQYDVEWAQAQLRTALSPLEPVFAVGKLLAGGETSDLLTSVVRNRASGVAHTRLIAGVKTDGTITKSLFVEYGDVFSEEVFAAENEDAHGLLLGFFGKPTQKASLGARVRIGDFHIELEDNLKGDLPLQASKACVEALEEMGVDCEHDVRVMFNGARSIVLRVRQDAFGVANCVELPALYRRFAALLYDLARPKVDYAEDLYDRELYNSNASYRLAGCVHRSNGFRATWISAACLCGAPSLSTLRSLPQGQQMLPFEARGAVPILRTTFDEATAGLARTTTHDENSRTKSTTTVARYQRSEKQRKLRLKVISEQKDPPCAEALMARADRGESIGFAPLAKAVLELRQRGGDRRAIAERLASGAGGPNRYETRLEFKPDGPDLIDSLWPDDPERSYYRSCSNDAARELCDFSECYRSRQPHVFSDEASPSFTEGRRLAYETTAKIAVPSEAGTVAYEVSPRSGKSTQIAEEAYERAKAGSRVLVVAQTHRALKQVAKYLAELMSAGPVYAVQLLGRGAQHEYCARDQRSRLSCKGCPKHAVIQVDGTWQKNPGLGGLSRRNLLVVTPEQSEALAGGSLCAKTTSHHLARSAPIVLATFAHLTNERWNEMARSGEMSVVFVDESDSLFDELSSGSDKLVLAMSRQSLDGVLASPCDMNCADCYLDFTASPSLDAWKGEQRVTSLHDHRSPETLFAALEKGLKVLEETPSLAPHISFEALRRNLEDVSKALPAHDRIRRGHPVSPKEYNAHLSARTVARDDHCASDGFDAEEDRVTFVPLRRCVQPNAPRAHKSDQWWRRDLLAPDLPVAASALMAALADIADFLDHAARVGRGVLLVPRSRPGTWATWMAGCSIELRTVDQLRVDRVRKYFSERRTVLVSGTQPDSALLKALLPDVEIAKLPVPLHRDLTIFMHTVPTTRRSDHFLPRRYEPEHVVELIGNVVLLAKRELSRRLRVRLYAKKRSEQQKMLAVARSLGLSGIELLDCTRNANENPTTRASISFDYLRSSESRAVDVDVDLLVIYGGGRPAYDGYFGFREVLAKAGAEVSVEMLAEDARIRAVVQALLRTAALPGRRVALLINDLNVGDLPSWLHHRVIAADSIYRAMPEVADADVRGAQSTAFAGALVDALRPRRELPTLEDLLSWSKDRRTSVGRRGKQANERRVKGMLAKAAEGGVLISSEPVGAATEWGLLLSWLEGRGVLRRVRESGRGGYVFTEDGLQHLKGLLG